MADLKLRLSNVSVSINQLIGTILSLGAKYPDETMSSYSWRLESKGRIFGRIFPPLIDTLLFWERDHCYGAWLDEKARRHMPPEMRDTPTKPG